MVRDLYVLSFPCKREKQKKIFLRWTEVYYYSVSWKQKFLSKRSRMEVSKNNWQVSLCSSELWLFFWRADKKLRVQKILMGVIQPQFLRPWHFSACEKLNWQEFEVWRVNKIDSAPQTFLFWQTFNFQKQNVPSESSQVCLGEEKRFTFSLLPSKATGQKDVVIVWTGTELWGTGLRKLLKEGVVKVVHVMYSIRMWFVCYVLSVYFWVKMESSLD